MQQHRSDSLPGCSSGCHAQLWPLPAFQPFVVSWALQAVPPWFFQLIPHLWLPVLPPCGYGTCQPLPPAQLSPLTLLVLSPGWSIPSLPQDILGRPAPLSLSDPITPDSTPLRVHPHTANTKRDSCLFFQARRTQEAVLAARPFLEALSDAAVCKPSSISGWMEVPHSSRGSRGASASDTQGCAEKHCCALISFLWHQIFPAHFDSPVILFPWCQGG